MYIKTSNITSLLQSLKDSLLPAQPQTILISGQGFDESHKGEILSQRLRRVRRHSRRQIGANSVKSSWY